MISSRKLVKMARKWQNLAALQRKRITIPGKNDEAGNICSHSSSLAEKGHFIVYTADKKRYAFTIVYLKNYILRELLKMSEKRLDYQVMDQSHYLVTPYLWITRFL
ncbi:Auxin-responsive protein SAUR68 [Abeliophyllum distichum]|uniref:Auxin-responsive protein SAUR68 n=1 Tax=Abeliophyllum distichum TaxID=126358 RepID=A0ABD1P864_9LAMI